jgi:hypothetical protein
MPAELGAYQVQDASNIAVDAGIFEPLQSGLNESSIVVFAVIFELPLIVSLNFV